MTNEEKVTSWARIKIGGAMIYVDVNQLFVVTRDNAVFEYSVADLEWVLDYPFWNNDDGKWLRPRDVIKGVNEPFRRHKHLLYECDLAYPIIVQGDERERHVAQVVDGVHRVTKAHLLKHACIPLVFASTRQLLDCQIPESRAAGGVERASNATTSKST